jgi:putative hydrolase of the HAD superfamily
MALNDIGVIFDGDDTLWETQSIYNRSKKQFFSEMENLGFSRKRVEAEFEKIDIANVNILGFSKHRFPKSMADTYRALCLEQNKPANKTIGDRFMDIGLSTFKKRPRFLPGATEVLEELSKRKLKLILATKGDPKIQKEKILLANVNRYFHKIYIFPHKGEREIQKVVDECLINPALSWSIGNSVKSDVNPALKIGMKAIWVQRRTWDYELEQLLDREGLFLANSMKDVMKILRVQIVKGPI